MSIFSKFIVFWIGYSLILSVAVGWALSTFTPKIIKPIDLDSLTQPHAQR
jgi:hypothetical protein